MSRQVLTLSSFVALGVVGALGVMGCESDTPESGTQPGLQPGVTFDGGPGSETGVGEGGVVDPPGGVLNSILGLSSKGTIVRVELGASGTEVDLGYPTLNGVEYRGIKSIARAPGGLYGVDPSKRSGSSLVTIQVPGLSITPFDPSKDFRAQIPVKEGLAASGSNIYASETQFGPLTEILADGTLNQYILRQANNVDDDTQCYTPEDLLFEGGILAAGDCASATQPEKNGYWVWEYKLGKPGTTGQGGIPTNKALKWKSPERILGLGKGPAGVVAVSSSRKLLTLVGDSFVVTRETKDIITDLE